MSYPSPTAETVTCRGHNGDRGEAHDARPTRPGKFPGMVAVHHLPGWDEWIIEMVRKLAHRGYACRGGAECAVGARW
jgi:carboxymethylenebutenolidase